MGQLLNGLRQGLIEESISPWLRPILAQCTLGRDGHIYIHNTLRLSLVWMSILVYTANGLGYVPFFPHGTLGRDGHRDTCIYSEWDRLGYVPFFPHGTMGQDGHRDTCIYGKWDRLGYVPFFPHGMLGQNGRTNTSIHGE